MVGGGDPFYLKFWVTGPRWSEIVDFQLFASSASAVAPSKKCSVNSYRKLTMHFPMSLRWTSYVAPKPPKGGLKNQNGHFRVKSYFTWSNSVTKFHCV